MNDDLTSLEGTQAAVWARLKAAMSDPAAPARTMALASCDSDGGASVRMVVLRAADEASGRIALYSHMGAQKVADLNAEPACEAVIWDAASRLQIRLRGVAEVSEGPRAIWDSMREADKALYAAAPGMEMEDPDDLMLFSPEPDPAHFALIQITLDAIETLHLAQPAHRRAQFVRSDNPGAWAGIWLTP